MAQMNFLTRDHGFKLALILVVVSSIFGTAYGQDVAKFGHRLLPEKMLENSEGILEVYAVQNNSILPQPIKDLTAISSDPSVLEIVGIKENENGIITDVSIKAIKAGTASVALVASGFSTDEFPITVYSNQNSPTQLLLKATPNSFSLNGPSKGYVTVELANSDGYPVSANQDTAVTLSLNDNSLLDLENNLVIKKGDYFSIAEFKVKDSGIATIFANAPSMKTASSSVSIDPDAGSAHLQLYVYPNKISSFYGSQSYAIVQLQNANGVPVKAKEDIFVSVKVSDASQGQVQSSSVVSNLSAGTLVINKGSYWGYSKISTVSGVLGSYSVSIAANNYPSSSSQEIDVTNVNLSGSKPFEFDPLPVLTTGQEELIGVLQLIDSDGNPLLANDNLVVNIDSTDKNSISVKSVKINKGFSNALVFAQTGITVPSSIELYDTNDNSKFSSPKIYGPMQGTQTLIADPLVPELLPGIKSPLLLYMTDSTNSSSYFPENSAVSISSTDLMQIEPKMISKGQDSLLLDTTALKPGTAPLIITTGNFESDPTITILSPKGAQLQLATPDSIITNFPNRFSVQLLDENGLPVMAESDKKVTLISNDKTIIDLPESVTILKGDYYELFDAKPLANGNAEIAMISNGLPLLKSDLAVTSINPTLILNAPNSVNKTSIFDASVTAQYNNDPLSGLKVEWNVKGAQIITMHSETDQDGNAGITLLADDPRLIDLQASVSGSVFEKTNTEKIVGINPPLQITTKTSNAAQKTNGFNILSLFVIIPVVVAFLIILKKKQKLVVLQIKAKQKLVSLQMKRVKSLTHYK